MRFKNNIALITAAANGIGRATAQIMAAEGAVVVCVDNHPERLDGAVAALASRRMDGCVTRWIRDRWTRLSRG
jgi:NAD(P)-dependent dehydrogenase (short-subunit alcohol dehydrogenase family)